MTRGQHPTSPDADATAPRRLLVAINPYASFGRNRHVGPILVERLERAGYEVAMLREENFELLRREVVSAVEQRPDALIVVGGDGMVSLAVNVLAGTGIPLGFVPAGTGNDFARGLGLPHDDPAAASDALLAALGRPPRTVDAALARNEAGETWYASVLSAGFDAVVNERANRMSRPRGASRYTIALVRELLTFRPRPYTLVIDGVRREFRGMLVSIANNGYIGGGMRIVPEARLDDGLLDVFIVHPLSKLGLIRVFPKVFSGTHTDHPAVEFLRARSVRLEGGGGVAAYADGERVGPLPVDVACVPGALRAFA